MSHLRPEIRASEASIKSGQAQPDEVAQMGRGDQADSDLVLEVFFADPARRVAITPSIVSTVLQPPPRGDVPDYSPRRGIMDLHLTTPNSGYYRELVRYTCARYLLAPLHLAIRNSGRSTAHDVRIEASVTGAAAGVIVMDSVDFPRVPQKEYQLTPMRLASEARQVTVQAQRVEDVWLIEARAEKVQPEAIVWLGDAVFVGSRVSGGITIDIAVYADNLASPHRQELAIPVTASTQVVTLEEILALEDDRLVQSVEHRAFLREHGLVDDPDPLDPV